MIIIIFEKQQETTLLDKERKLYFFEKVTKPAFIEKWDKEVKYKERLYAKLVELLVKYNYTDDEIWQKIIEQIKSVNRFNNINNYNILLNGLIWLNTTPKHKNFKKLEKVIEEFKTHITRNENRNWKYDVEKARLRTFQELVEKREELNYRMISKIKEVKNKQREIVQKKEEEKIDLNKVKTLILSKLASKTPMAKIKKELEELEIDKSVMDQALVVAVQIYNDQKMDELKKKGRFIPDMTPEQLAEYTKKAEAPAGGAAAGGAGGAAAGGAKDAKKKK